MSKSIQGPKLWTKRGKPDSKNAKPVFSSEKIGVHLLRCILSSDQHDKNETTNED